MNVQLLIDAIVRQTTVLIAQLATTGGIRAPVAHLANQVFLDLSRELDAQGVSRKVSADMFGMALRAYLRKIQRLGESSTEHGRSLWEAVYDFLRSRSFVARSDVIRHFARDDEAVIRGILHDLTENGLVLQVMRSERQRSGASSLVSALACSSICYAPSTHDCPDRPSGLAAGGQGTCPPATGQFWAQYQWNGTTCNGCSCNPLECDFSLDPQMPVPSDWPCDKPDGGK